MLAAALGGQSAAQALAPGALLVATAKVRDPELAKSVVLLVMVSREAAVGITVNRPLLARSASEISPKSANPSDPLWIGGPVPVGTNALINAAAPPAGSKRLLPDLFWLAGHDIVARASLPPGSRIYLGTCGWTMRQLESELRRGYWRVVPGRSAAVFDPDALTLWERLLAAP
jgi:putative transcriptional regulator